MTGSGRGALQDDREWSRALPDVQEWLGGPHDWPGGPPGCPGVVERHSWMSRSGREALPHLR